MSELLIERKINALEDKLTYIEGLIGGLQRSLEKIEEAVNPEDQVITQKQACRLLGISDKTFKKMRENQTLDVPYQKTARKILYKKSDILSWLKMHN
ncbi:MAG: helix-turn-helix domain-containing protein [Candidatus Cloacimonetes bacterium]|nr:helix-turn-helix domain-containing protein [Candidatus Cloacimonadota bacterium]